MFRSLLLCVAFALTMFVSAHTFRASGATVLVNEYPVFTLKATLDGLTPAIRASRIVDTLTKGPVSAPLDMRATARGIWVQSGSVPVVRVTEQEAKLQGVAPKELAIAWKNRVEYALQLPPVQAANNFAVVPMGGKVLVRLIGTEALQSRFEVGDPSVVKAELVEGGVQLSGLQSGDCEVAILSPSGRTRVVVKVQASAVLEIPQLTAEIFGSPGSPTQVEAAVTSAVRSQIKTAEEATIEILSIAHTAVPAGSVVDVPVKLRIRAPQTVPYEGNVTVKVRNIGASRDREQELWTSNDPESVRGPGPLFSAVLGTQRRVRMLYHHLNESTEALTIEVVVYNPSPIPAQMIVTRGDGVPDTDPVRTGMDAAEVFLKSWLTTNGQVVNVPAFSSLPLAIRRLPRNYTMSGLCSLALLPGGPQSLVIRAEAQRPNTVDPTWRDSADLAAPWSAASPVYVESVPNDIAQTRHVYEKPFRDVSAVFRVGGKHTFVRIGQSAVTNVVNDRELQGNYGVMYTVNATLENPTNAMTRVEIVFEASAGYSGGIFVVDGEVSRTALIQSKEEMPLKVVRLAPGEKRLVKIMTMPLSGSNYPATIVMRPAGLNVPPVAQLPTSPR